MNDEHFPRSERGEQVEPDHKSGAHCRECHRVVAVEQNATGETCYVKHYSNGYGGQRCYKSEAPIGAAPRDNVDHQATTGVVCPWCGHERRPDCGPEEHQGAQTCGQCDRPFDCDYRLEVFYTTERIDPAAYSLREQLRKEAWEKRRAEKKQA